MWKRTSKEKIFCGLDMGCESLKAAILKFSSGQTTLLAIADNPVQGFRDSSITDLAEFSECLHQTLDEAAKKGNVKVKDIHLGLGSDVVESRLTGAVIPLLEKGRKIIARRDIARVNEQARLLGLKMDEEILHEVTQSYLVDDENEAKNPLGLYGRKMAVQSLLLLTRGHFLRNMIQAVHQAGYEVSGYSLSSYAASQMILTQDERQGAIVIDLGSRVTSLLVFEDGLLRFFKKIAFGGRHLTKKISQDMNIAWESAEEIKKQFASVIASDRLQEEEILFKREEQYIPLRRSRLYQAIEPGIKDFLTEIHRVIIEANTIVRSIVVVGGGALVPGVIERIGEETHMPVRLGYMTHAAIKSPALFAAAVGLARLDVLKNLPQQETSNEVKGRWALINHKLKEIYNEYF